MSYRKLLFTILFLLAIDSYASVVTVSTHVHDMEFRDLARKWDEAIPLGNATIGSLIWQKGERLRMSIDRSDLWDLRHSKELEGGINNGSKSASTPSNINQPTGFWAWTKQRKDTPDFHTTSHTACR